jgi:hypothetical protein
MMRQDWICMKNYLEGNPPAEKSGVGNETSNRNLMERYFAHLFFK